MMLETDIIARVGVLSTTDEKAYIGCCLGKLSAVRLLRSPVLQVKYTIGKGVVGGLGNGMSAVPNT